MTIYQCAICKELVISTKHAVDKTNTTCNDCLRKKLNKMKREENKIKKTKL